MIGSLADKATEDIFHGRDSREARSIPKALWAVARRKLDALNAHTLEDLRVPPANRLKKLRGDLAGRYSIRVNQQYRIVFRFENAVASQVKLTDYH